MTGPSARMTYFLRSLTIIAFVLLASVAFPRALLGSLYIPMLATVSLLAYLLANYIFRHKE
ncbi:hypothetical protein GCM10007235_25120 [Pseudoxanthomonas indica]|nr:hypothetical protein GCM10007235_25120 [Pseudoxanthomonas indica]